MEEARRRRKVDLAELEKLEAKGKSLQSQSQFVPAIDAYTACLQLYPRNLKYVIRASYTF
jgi:hypothetical protein